MEVLAAALERLGTRPASTLFALMDVAEDVVAPLMPSRRFVDRTSLSLGYAGVYSIFLLHAERRRALRRRAARLLMELGRRRPSAARRT